MGLSLFVYAALISAVSVNGLLFPSEEIRLTDADIGNFSAIAFAADSASTLRRRQEANCRAFPDTEDWPPESEWDALAASLNGALLKPLPPHAVCYSGEHYDSAACAYLSAGARTSRFYIDDPVTVLSNQYQGNTCPIPSTPTSGNCTQGGFPVYVVNATTVRDIQIAVNFARNRNIRLSIKNTGHDFLGRNLGAGSISVWTHYLKDFELIRNYTVGRYRGMAAHAGSGIETWENLNHMVDYNISLVTALSATVGGYGGYMAGGGHSTVTSLWGMASDQVLSLNVVTADGRFVTADPETNTDLFFALRGGGGSTFGIVTSAVVKARPSIPVTIAMDAYFAFAVPIVRAGGIDRNYVTPATNSYTFSTAIEMPNMSVAQTNALLRPLFDQLRRLGLTSPRPEITTGPIGSRRSGTGSRPGGSRFTSRLFPRANWDNQTVFANTMRAIRRTVELGYTFHGLFMTPSERVAGWPGTDSGLNPVWRTSIMHADLFDRSSVTGTAATLAAYERLENATDLVRAVTPGSGAYVNEAGTREPNWQTSFFGSNYPRLLQIKRARDPWNVFWAPETVGSEGWQVITSNGLPWQNGRLCRVS